MFTQPVEDAAERCPACPVAPEDGTGGGSGNRTGVESFLFLSRSMLYAPCAMLVTPLGRYQRTAV